MTTATWMPKRARNRRSACLLATLLATASPPAALAETLYVRTGGNDDLAVPGDPALPYATPGGAYADAQDGDVIDIGAGEFTGRLFISRSLTINGASRDATVLQAAEEPGTSSFDVLTVNSTTAVISNLTVRHGAGGVRLSGSTPVATLDNVRVTRNRTTTFGSAVRLNSGQLLITDSEITDNTSGSFSAGGGLHNFNGQVTMRRTLIAGNSSPGDGGGIYNAGNLTIENCTVRDNTAGSTTDSSDGGEGGGIFNQGTLTITNSTLSTNRAGNSTGGGDGGRGGAIHHFGGELVVGSCTLDHNIAGDGLNGGAGGGIYARAGTLTITNTTVDSNRTGNNSPDNADGTGPSGGGIFARNGVTADLLFNTVTRNTCTGGGTGGGLHALIGGEVTIGGSVFAENTTGTEGGTDLVAAFTDRGGNFFSTYTGWIGTPEDGAPPSVFGEFGEILDPGLGELQDNGGPTHTRAPDPDSPLIDIGPSVEIDNDQTGTERPQGDAPDAGSVERVERDGVDLAVSHLGFAGLDPAKDAIVVHADISNLGEQTATEVTLEIEIVPTSDAPDLDFTLEPDSDELRIFDDYRMYFVPDKPIPQGRLNTYFFSISIPPSQTGAYTLRATAVSAHPDLNPADNVHIRSLDLGGDNDDDGVNDFFDPDDDNDGIPDYLEVLRNLDPDDPSDALADNDGDGITNLAEANGGTDPNNAESRFEIVDFVAETDGNKVTALFVLPASQEHTSYTVSLENFGELDEIASVLAFDEGGGLLNVERDQSLFSLSGTGGRITFNVTVCPTDGADRPVDGFLLKVTAVPALTIPPP